MADVIFHTHATAETGFGHAARCGRIAGQLGCVESALDIAFEGEFQTAACSSILAMAPARFAETEECARVGVYDRMEDPEDPELWSAAGLASLRNRCNRVVFLANGFNRPEVPDEVLVVGYKPGGPAPSPPKLRWGLEYAPVDARLLDAGEAPREPDRALVALGGAKGSDSVRTALRSLALVPEIAHVDFLDSPVNPINPDLAWLRSDQTLEVHRAVPSVAALIARAGMVLASYGHLGYEALALGSPLCLVGQKRFQAEYADRLAARGLCIAAGRLSDLEPNTLARSVNETLKNAERLSRTGTRAVDGRGIERLAALIGALLGASQ